MVYILLGEGFEEIEAVVPCDILRRGGVAVSLVGINGPTARGGQGIAVSADITLGEIDLGDAEMLVIPGGVGGVKSIMSSPEALEIIRKAHEMQVALAAICAGPTVLASLGITDGCDAVCYPGTEVNMGGAHILQNTNVVVGDKLITGRAPGAAYDFGLALLTYLRGKEIAEQVRAGMCYAG